ncbi:SDR family NAD(P)-dependent oxidoreductase [Pseudomonas eucalypticola]|uniref:SDR family oxidoreductase n=1 Tax=Pseudomonas eucalypticola TaxID=2599595 RepID=A0A7D5H5E6_9PSED|nr:SDR family oxidoreductase [Pseudomonas eucalypticola]QKZ04469.1 SDR family oxidoreductase [Pseudomonas eucalypticola]
MTEHLQSRVALITGAAGGLGHAFALRLAAAGLHIAVVDCVDTGPTVRTIQAQGGTAQGFHCDLRQPEQIAYLGRQVLEHFGRCDVLVNNAAWIPLKSLDETSLLDWSDCQAVTLDAPFLLSQLFAPGMRERGWGRIVNLASSNTGRPQKGFLAYIAAKMGVIGLTRALAVELGEHGVTVNAISPGLIRHPGSAAALPAQLFEQVRASQMIKRNGVPEDLCGVLAFIASDESSYMTGQVFNLDGGFVL